MWIYQLWHGWSGIDNMAGGPKTSDKDCQKDVLFYTKVLQSHSLISYLASVS